MDNTPLPEDSKAQSDNAIGDPSTDGHKPDDAPVPPQGENQAKTKPKAKTQAQKLIEIALEKYKLGISNDGKAFGYSLSAPHVAMYLKSSKLGLRQTLRREYFRTYGSPVVAATVGTACDTLEGLAYELTPTQLHLRVAGDRNVIYIDMANEANQVIQMAVGKWQVVKESPYVFRRTVQTKPMPMPVHDGDFDKLWRYINIKSEDRPLLTAILVDALINPDTAKPVTALGGEQGSAKTASSKCLISLIDPCEVLVHSPPKDLEHWLDFAAGSWAVGLDNLSSIPDWMSDAFCRGSTESGRVKRALYSDDDITLSKFRRCVVLNGIDFSGLKGDLADRIILFNLQPIAESDRKTDADLEDAWIEDWPIIFGGLLDLAAQVHDLMFDLPACPLPRMADFGQVLVCLDKITNSNVVSHYRDLQQRALTDSAVSSPFIAALIAARFDTTDEGMTAAQILKVITAPCYPPPAAWPLSAKGATSTLKRNAPALRKMGWKINDDAGENQDNITKWFISCPLEKPEQGGTGIRVKR
jgi:hypothetical protein